jgi:threonine synthase
LFLKLIDNTKKNIWRYAKFYTPFIKEQDRLTLEEGGVRCIEYPKLNEEFSDYNNRRIIFKREDENPTGSHKARALAYQVSFYRSKGHNTLLLSSSGNAAIAAASYCCLCNIRLISFVDKTTPKAKIDEIKKTKQPLIFCAKPINFAKYAARIFNIPNLRPSFDDLSIEPYKSIAFEIFEEFGEGIDAVFLFPTSASSLIGTARGFLQLKDEQGAMNKIPRIIAVQTGAITSIARQFANKDTSKSFERTGETDTPGKLGVKATRRTDEALEVITKTRGTGIIVNPDEILKADTILKQYGILTSIESAATLAGAIRLRDLQNVVCILSGREYQDTTEKIEGSVFYAESYTDVKNILNKLII